MKATMQQGGSMGDQDGMDELYETPKNQPESIDDKEAEEMNTTAVIPLKVLQGKHPDPPKVGDEVVLKVKQVDGDQAIVEYSETPAGEIGKEEMPEGGDYQSADDELEELGKQY